MIFLFGFLGFLCGVLVNYLADILPVRRRPSKPVCTSCYQAQDLINYFIWPRRCSNCHQPRPWRVWVVEILFTGISIGLWLRPPDRIGFLLSLVLMIYFGVVILIDLEHRLILHPVSWVGAALCLGAGWYLHRLPATLIGGAAGYGLMLGVYYFGRTFARWLGRRRGAALTEEALGFGDVNLSGVLGLLLGWPGILAGLLVAILLGGFFSLVYLLIMVIARRYRLFMAIPYGPFLVLSAVYLLFLRDLLS